MHSKASHAGQFVWRVLSKRKGSSDLLPANIRGGLTNGSQRPAWELTCRLGFWNVRFDARAINEGRNGSRLLVVF